MRIEVEYLDGTETVFEEERESESGFVLTSGDWPQISAIEGLVQIAYSDGRSTFIPVSQIKAVTAIPQKTVL